MRNLFPALLVASMVFVTGACAAPKPVSLPPSETNAKAALEHSPRHGEFVNVPFDSTLSLRTYVVYPETQNKAGVVLVIHEIFGLSDWIRGLGDQLAKDGFIAVVPDLISGLGPGGGGTDSVATRDEVVQLIRGLDPAAVAMRLKAVRAYALNLPAANGKIASMGFCWGGARSFEFAATSPSPHGAVVFYGAPPDSAMLAKVGVPVIGFYGGDDARITATVEPTRALMKTMGKSYEPYVFAGAGHGFLRMQEDRNGANLTATQKAWPKAIEFLKRVLK